MRLPPTTCLRGALAFCCDVSEGECDSCDEVEDWRAIRGGLRG